MTDRVKVDYCPHTIPAWAVEEKCRTCRQRATHKVEEVSGPDSFHSLTAYLCCGCFQMIVRYDCSTYPYDADDQLGGWPAKPFDIDEFIEVGRPEAEE